MMNREGKQGVPHRTISKGIFFPRGKMKAEPFNLETKHSGKEKSVPFK
jgi:hypothetical protein